MLCLSGFVLYSRWVPLSQVVIYFDFWRDWYAFGNSTTKLMIQSSSFAESA